MLESNGIREDFLRQRNITINVYKKFGIVHAKIFLNHLEIDTTMEYLNIDYMEVINYGL